MDLQSEDGVTHLPASHPGKLTNQRSFMIMENYVFISRIVFLIILVSGCLLHWHWKASLISYLSVEIPKVPFENMEELIGSSYQITTMKDSSWQTEFQCALDGPFKTAWETKFENKELSLQSDPKEMIKLTMSGAYAMYYYLYGIITMKEYK